MLNFPDAPGLSQTFTDVVAGCTWVWDGVKWLAHTATVKYLHVIPASGDTLTTPAGLQAYRIDPLGELVALTVVMPPSPLDGDMFFISTTQTIDTLTISPVAPATMAATSGGDRGVLSANGGLCWQFNAALNQWFPVV